MQIKKLTPVLVVAHVEPCLEFWTKQAGFRLQISVPEGDRVGFAMLERDGIEIMYQSEASVAKDIPAILAGGPTQRTTLFIEVDDVDALERALTGVPQLMPRRKTFYGADEVIVADPAGHVIVFAQISRS
jgi:uncharacterized glyoxalase superfamily protein PhnB